MTFINRAKFHHFPAKDTKVIDGGGGGGIRPPGCSIERFTGSSSSEQIIDKYSCVIENNHLSCCAASQHTAERFVPKDVVNQGCIVLSRHQLSQQLHLSVQSGLNVTAI